jgi:hypothetical protein
LVIYLILCILGIIPNQPPRSGNIILQICDNQ